MWWKHLSSTWGITVKIPFLTHLIPRVPLSSRRQFCHFLECDPQINLWLCTYISFPILCICLQKYLLYILWCILLKMWPSHKYFHSVVEGKVKFWGMLIAHTSMLMFKLLFFPPNCVYFCWSCRGHRTHSKTTA